MAVTDIYHISGSLHPARKAVSFLGGAVDDGVQIDAFAAARVLAADTAGTFTAWINVPNITGTYAILGCGDADAVEYITFNVETGKLMAALYDAAAMAWDTNSTNVVLTPHKWHHVALVHNGVRPLFYVDGVAVAMTDTTTTSITKWFAATAGIDGAHIGAADSIAGGAALTEEYKGAISDVKYWKIALTATQLLDDFYGKDPTKIFTATAADFISWWDFDDDYIDSKGGYTGTAVGDIVLVNNFSEFTSRLKYSPAAPIVVADKFEISCTEANGHAVIVKAA